MNHYSGAIPDTLRAPDWHADALCARSDMDQYRELFFPTPGDTKTARRAKEICTACPVRLACLADALAEEGSRGRNNRHGIRGGLSPSGRFTRYERNRKARQVDAKAGQLEKEPKPEPVKRQPAQCGTRPGYQKHLREKTQICGPCRQANTDADNRLRRTGTTKVAV